MSGMVLKKVLKTKLLKAKLCDLQNNARDAHTDQTPSLDIHSATQIKAEGVKILPLPTGFSTYV